MYADFQVNSDGDLIAGVDGTTNQLVLDNGGNVGLGTSDPGDLLHLTKSSNNNYIRIDADATNQAGVRFSKAGTLSWYMYQPASSTDLRFYNGSDLLTLTSGGALTASSTIQGANFTNNYNGVFQWKNTSIQTAVLKTDGNTNSLGAIVQSQGAGFQVLDSGGNVDLYVNSAGNVGIGTTGPDRKLDILDASSPQLRLTQAEGSVYADFQVNSDGDLIAGVDGTTNQLVLDNGGNVGIGTTSPTSKLEIAGNTTISNGILGVTGTPLTNGSIRNILDLTDISNAATGIGPGIAFSADIDSSATQNYYNLAGIRAYKVAESGYSGQLHFQTRLQGSDPSTRMVINESGSIGIGTTDQFGSGVKVLSLGNATTAPTTTLTDAALFYASGGEMFVYDAAGNATQISPHDPESGLWVYNSTNTASEKTLFVEMEKLTKDLDQLLGGGYVFENGKEYYSGPSELDDLKFQLTNNNFQTISNDQITNSQTIELQNEIDRVKELAESYKEKIGKLAERVEALETLSLLQPQEDVEGSEPYSDVLSASDSAELTSAPGVEQIDTSGNPYTFESLMVLGATTLSDTVVNGKLNVGSLTFDNITGGIDAIGNLKLQTLELGALDVMNGKFVFDTRGNLTIKEGVLAGNDEIRGSIKIQAGETKVNIEKDWEKVPASIVATPNYNAQVWITEKSDKGFTVNLSSSPSEEASVDWWAVW